MVRFKHWFQHHRSLVGFVFLALLASWGIWKAYQNSSHIERESIQRDYVSCQTANDGRKALKDVIEIATQAGQTPDLTLMPSYATLTPTGQQFVRELNEVFRQANAANDTRGLRAFSDERLVLRNCEEILQEK